MYEVDDVSVISSNATAYAGPDVYAATGDTVAIGATTNGGGMPCYWYTLGGTAPIDSGGTIKVRAIGTTTYVVSMDLCGTVTYDTVTVTDTGCGAAPVAAYTYWASPVLGGTDTMGFVYAGTGAVDSVRWDFGDGGTGSGLSTIHVYTVPPDSFNVCMMVYGPCGNDTVCRWVYTVSVTLGISPQPSPKERVVLRVWPNPAGDEVHVDGLPSLRLRSGQAGGVVYRVVNMTGVSVQEGVLNSASNTLSIKDYSPGVYILEMTSADGERTVVRLLHTSQ